MGIAYHLYAHSGQTRTYTVKLTLETSQFTFRTHTKLSKQATIMIHTVLVLCGREQAKNKGDTALDKQHDNEIPVSRWSRHMQGKLWSFRIPI
jgi:hypothetical protein